MINSVTGSLLALVETSPSLEDGPVKMEGLQQAAQTVMWVSLVLCAVFAVLAVVLIQASRRRGSLNAGMLKLGWMAGGFLVIALTAAGLAALA